MTGVADQLVAAGMSAGAAESRAAMFERAEEALRALQMTAHFRFHVPGRIEVLGKHTDYAGGRSLLAAVERGFCVVSAPRPDRIVQLTDVGRGDRVTLSLDPGAAPVTTPHWAIYPATAARRLVRDFGSTLNGVDLAFISDLPPSSGLSSSSALLTATFEALRLANELDARDDFRQALPGVLEVAAYLGSVESGRPFRGFGGEAGVGTSGGSQDHTAILASQAGRLTLVRFAPVRAEGSVALPAGLTFAIAVSGVVAQKTAGARAAYNRAAALSAAILRAWQESTGRGDQTLFDAIQSSPEAPQELREVLRNTSSEFAARDLEGRLDQFVDESTVLIPAAFKALSAGDLASFGEIVDRSQAGAEQGLQNQVPETMALPRLARSLGAHASSAFGAGFGGSVWALVSSHDAERFLTEWEKAYRAKYEHPGAAFFRTTAGPPLTRLRP